VAAAASQRALLSERDAAQLAALQADLTTDKMDFEASARRSRELADRFPGDAELALRAGERGLETVHPADGLALLDRAIKLDPKFALPYVLRGSYQVGAGDLAGAVSSTDECLAVAPSAASCLRLRASVEVRLGQCDAFAADAHTMTTMDPEGAYSYYARMDALVAQGAPEASIAETMRRSLAFETDPVARADRAACDPALLATLSGDFTAAIATFPAVEAFLGGITSDEIVGLDTQWMMNILDEAGQPDRALALADGYMKRLPALTEDDAVGWGRCATLRRWHKAGRITDAEFRAKREEWAQWGKARMPARYANSAWLYFYAGTVTSAEDARSALLELPRYSPLPPFDGETYLERAMGNTLLLAGRVDEALPHLRRGAAACLRVDHINAHQGAAKLLGEALEAKGDVAGACAAHAEVLAHWGHAKPRSVTADIARARMAKLGCPR
jgi:serine/threonine-protein kinase